MEIRKCIALIAAASLLAGFFGGLMFKGAFLMNYIASKGDPTLWNEWWAKPWFTVTPARFAWVCIIFTLCVVFVIKVILEGTLKWRR